MHNFILTMVFAVASCSLIAQPQLQADLSHTTNSNKEFIFKSNAATLQPQLRRISETNKKVKTPFIKHFWEFDDGTFTTSDQATHSFGANDSRVVQLVMTPCYTLDKIKPTAKTVQASRSIADAKRPAIDETFSGALRLTSNLTLHGIKAVRANDQFTGIVSYRSLIGDKRNAKLYVFFNKTDQITAKTGRILTLKDARLQGATMGVWGQETAEVTKLKKDYYDTKVYEINGLDKFSHNLFLTFGVEGKEGFEKIPQLDIAAALVVEGSNQIEKTSMTFETNSSFDPNNIKAPRLLSFRGINNKTFKYRINFENLGNAPAQSVNVKLMIPDALDATSIQNIKAFPTFQNTARRDSAMKYTISPDGKSISFNFKNIILNGVEEAWNPRKKDTRGFIEYEIKTKKDIRKRSIESNAVIVFDNNEPIPTDPHKLHFKAGHSIGVKAGVSYQPNSKGYNYFIGATYSAYRPAGIYNQMEVMADLTQRALVRDSISTHSIIYPTNAEAQIGYDKIGDSSSLKETYKRVNAIRIVPLNLHYDFPKFASVGLGIYADLSFLQQQDFTTATIRKFFPFFDVSGKFVGYKPENCQFGRKKIANKSSNQVDYGLLGDIMLGKYSNGLALGLRFMQPLKKEKSLLTGDNGAVVASSKLQKGFFQLYLSYKIL